MRRIAIVGAGQAGLQLAIGLLRKGYYVHLFTNRSASQILRGRILSSQGMFDSALRRERELGLNFWDKSCPNNIGVTFTLAAPNSNEIAFSWNGRTIKPYQSIDQRLKFSRWLEHFESSGGKVTVQDVGFKELDGIAKWHELTVVAGGKGEISQLFPRDDRRSKYSEPQRSLACLYVKGMEPVNNFLGVRANIIPGVGEFFTMPGLTISSGHCEMMLFEGVPGGPFDCWKNIQDTRQQLARALSLLEKFVPWEAARCKKAELTDEQGTLIGKYTPVVRHPTFQLPCGKHVLGLADTVVLNDPVAGQGANNAAKAADLYMQKIVEHGATKPFDETWMTKTFEEYWNGYAKYATDFSSLLLEPPKPHVIGLLSAAVSSPAIASMIANGFDEPATLFPWINDPADTEKMMATLSEAENAERSYDSSFVK